MKLGIYGGTFNPPHLGHLAAARFALDALELDELRFVPAATPPHKALPAGSPSAEQRLEMGCCCPKRWASAVWSCGAAGKAIPWTHWNS